MNEHSFIKNFKSVGKPGFGKNQRPVVLSLFDGMSCGRIALDRAGIKPFNYYASEIDKKAIEIADKNYPQTIQLGDIENWRNWNITKPNLIIAGSPCQGFSFAGKQLNFNDERSKLFFTFIDILKHYKPDYFLLENVKMKKQWQDVITEYIGVEPVFICSSNFSAQKRKRLYWTNIPDIKEMKQSNNGDAINHILSGDIGAEMYLNREQIERAKRKHAAQTLSTGTRMGRVKFPTPLHEKSKCLNTVRIKGDRTMTHVKDSNGIRLLTPNEYEKLQNVPVDYTQGVNNNHRYKMLGNGWTIDVIAHIFNGLKSQEGEKIFNKTDKQHETNHEEQKQALGLHRVSGSFLSEGDLKQCIKDCLIISPYDKMQAKKVFKWINERWQNDR